MTKRISLVEGLKRDKDSQEALDPAIENSFVRLGKARAGETATDAAPMPQQAPMAPEERRSAASVRKAKNGAVIAPGLIPVNVRVRPDIAAALQTASLDRQLQGIDPCSKREIVEEALEPWLRANGYLK